MSSTLPPRHLILKSLNTGGKVLSSKAFSSKGNKRKAKPHKKK